MKLANFRNLQEAIDAIDYASNASGLLCSMLSIREELRAEGMLTSTNDFNKHPIIRYFLQKLIDLSGGMVPSDYYIEALEDLKKFSERLHTTKLKGEL